MKKNAINHLKRFQSFVKDNHLFDKQEPLYLAFSGGVDSCVLLDLLIRGGHQHQLKLVHFNHGTRQTNVSEEEFARSIANKYQIELIIKRLKNLSDTNFEAMARNARYRELQEIAQGGTVLLGHHIDDSFEWALMQRFKSATMASSIGIPLVNGNLKRPLMCFTKEQIRAYVNFFNLDFREDPTNSSTDHERNYLRHIIVPKIKQKYPAYLQNYVAQARALSAQLGLSWQPLKHFHVVKAEEFSEIYSFDHAGEYDLLDGLIVAEVKRLSPRGRGVLRNQIGKIKQAMKNNKLGPLLLGEQLFAYISYNHVLITKCEARALVWGHSRLWKLEEFEAFLKGKCFFGTFVEVRNYRLNSIKRAYPFTSTNIGKIAALDLCRQWGKKKHRNRRLHLVF